MQKGNIKVDLGPKFEQIIDAMMQPVARSATFTVAELVRFYRLAENLGKQGERFVAILESGIRRARKASAKLELTRNPRFDLPRNPRWALRKKRSANPYA